MQVDETVSNGPSQPAKRHKPEPFRRVQSEQVLIDPRLKDNSFEAKVKAQFLDATVTLHKRMKV